jgi:hypothetical protein
MSEATAGVYSVSAGLAASVLVQWLQLLIHIQETVNIRICVWDMCNDTEQSRWNSVWKSSQRY